MERGKSKWDGGRETSCVKFFIHHMSEPRHMHLYCHVAVQFFLTGTSHALHVGASHRSAPLQGACILLKATYETHG